MTMNLFLAILIQLSPLSFAVGTQVQCAELFARVNTQLEQLVDQKLLPEALRRARELNLSGRATQIEMTIVQSLQSDLIIGFPRYLAQGSTEVYLVNLASGLKAIFKPDPQHWVVDSKNANKYLSNSHAEVAAYQLSHALGLHLVPPTVLRQVDGKTGSLQVFVQGEQLVPALFAEFGGRTQGLIEQASDLLAFDYLIRNPDRGQLNIIVYDLFLWAIDNGSSFYPNSVRLARLRVEDIPTFKLSQSFLDGINAITPEILREMLKDYPDKLVVEEVIIRRQHLLSHLSGSR
jgi:hypothetical protein